MRNLSIATKIKTTLILCALALGVSNQAVASAGQEKRAAVLLMKDYGVTSPGHANLAVCVLVGAGSNCQHDKLALDPNTGKYKKTGVMIDYVNFFGGIQEAEEMPEDTAARELFEETGMSIIKTPEDIVRYSLSGTDTRSKTAYTFFAHRVGKDVSAGNIGQAMKVALTTVNPDGTPIESKYRETKDCYAIPLDDILIRAQQLATMKSMPKVGENQEMFLFQSRGKGNGKGRTEVYLDQHYLRGLAAAFKLHPESCMTTIYAALGA